MKPRILLLAAIAISLNASAQTTMINETLDLNKSINSETQLSEFDANGDGINDFRLTYWANHEFGTETVCELLMLNSNLSGLSISDCGFVRPCGFAGSVYPDVVGYLYTSDSQDCTNPSGTKNFPFLINNSTESVVLTIVYTDSTITFESFTHFSDVTYSCGTLGVDEYQMGIGVGKIRYFNVIGQEILDIDNTNESLIIKTYENGVTEKIYRN